MNTGIFYILYLVTMIFTYLWRYMYLGMVHGMVESGIPQEQAVDTSLTFITWALIVNYILLALISYFRGKRINKKFLTAFPIIGGVFDVLLAFIPFVPTIMNIITLVMAGDSKEKEVKVIYVEKPASEVKS